MYKSKDTAEGCMRRLQRLLPSVERSENAVKDINRFSADNIEKLAAQIDTTIRSIAFTDFVFPGADWNEVKERFSDQLMFSLMFPAEFRKQMHGNVYIWNRKKRSDTEEPYFIQWSEVAEFVSWHTATIGNFYDGDVFFVFEKENMITLCNHEGRFCHLLIYDKSLWSSSISPSDGDKI